MQIIRPILGPGVYAVERTTMQTPVGARPVRSDVAVDITSNIRSNLSSARSNGSRPLAAFYDGLMDRMKLMEAQSLPISVVA